MCVNERNCRGKRMKKTRRPEDQRYRRDVMKKTRRLEILQRRNVRGKILMKVYRDN